MLSSIFLIFVFIYRKLFILFCLGKISSDLTLLVDVFKLAMHPNTMCMTNCVLL